MICARGWQTFSLEMTQYSLVAGYTSFARTWSLTGGLPSNVEFTMSPSEFCKTITSAGDLRHVNALGAATDF